MEGVPWRGRRVAEGCRCGSRAAYCWTGGRPGGRRGVGNVRHVRLGCCECDRRPAATLPVSNMKVAHLLVLYEIGLENRRIGKEGLQVVRDALRRKSALQIVLDEGQEPKLGWSRKLRLPGRRGRGQSVIRFGRSDSCRRQQSPSFGRARMFAARQEFRQGLGCKPLTPELDMVALDRTIAGLHRRPVIEAGGTVELASSAPRPLRSQRLTVGRSRTASFPRRSPQSLAASYPAKRIICRHRRLVLAAKTNQSGPTSHGTGHLT